MSIGVNVRWPVYALVLLAVYSVLLPPRERAIPDGVLTISQAHRVKAEDFLLHGDDPQVLLVGSSLSAALPREALRGVYNLSFAGGSASTGLRLIEARAKTPKVLFIEVNMLTRPSDELLLAEVINTATLSLKRWCAACLARNQPLTVGLSYLSWWRLKESDEQKMSGATVATAASMTHSAALLATNLESASKSVTAGAMNHLSQDLAPRLESLRRAGTRIVFVDMPLHPQVASAAYNQSSLAVVQARFPQNAWEWLRFQDREYSTGDGMHLQYPDARSVALRIAAHAGYLNNTVYP